MRKISIPKPGNRAEAKLAVSFLALLGAFLFAFSGTGFAATPKNFEEANALYAAGKFKEAKQAYESVRETGNYSANLFYNLGNTEFRLGNPGQAALNYERALRLEPSHPEARANLALVRSQNGAKITPRTWQDVFFLEFTPNAYAILVSLAGWATLFCLVAAFFKKQRQGLVAAAVVCGLITGYCFAATRYLTRDESLAVVTAKRSNALYAPMEGSTLAETLPAASHVRILTHSGAWAYCDLPNGTRAWLPNDSIELLNPQSATAPQP